MLDEETPEEISSLHEYSPPFSNRTKVIVLRIVGERDIRQEKENKRKYDEEAEILKGARGGRQR